MFTGENRAVMSLARVGRVLGVGSAEVQRLERQALAKLRDGLVGMVTGAVVVVTREWLVANAPERWPEAPVGEAEWPEFYAELVWQELLREDAVKRRLAAARTRQRLRDKAEAGGQRIEGRE